MAHLETTDSPASQVRQDRREERERRESARSTVPSTVVFSSRTVQGDNSQTSTPTDNYPSIFFRWSHSALVVLQQSRIALPTVQMIRVFGISLLSVFTFL